MMGQAKAPPHKTGAVRGQPDNPRQVVLLGSDPQAPGGISTVLRTLLESELAQRWPLRMLPTWQAGGLARRSLTALRAAAALWNALACGRVYAVHAHLAAHGSFWRKAVLVAPALALRVPVVLHVHDGRFAHWHAAQGPLRQGLIRRALERADRVVALSEAWRQTLQAIAPQADIRVIGNPVAMDEQAMPCQAGPNPDAAPQVLFLSRLWPQKGVHELLCAAALVQTRHPGVRWLLAGDGDAQALHQQAQALGIAHAVRICGWLNGSAKQQALHRSALLVLPSHAEGQPMAVLEAMAAGKPVVATSVGGLPELLASGAGHLVPPRDVPALATAILSLLQDRPMAHGMGLAGRAHVAQHHHTPRIVAALDALYRDLPAKT